MSQPMIAPQIAPMARQIVTRSIADSPRAIRMVERIAATTLAMRMQNAIRSSARRIVQRRCTRVRKWSSCVTCGAFETRRSSRAKRDSRYFFVVHARIKFGDRLFYAFQVRVNLQRALVALQCVADPAFVCVAMSHAGPGAEVIRV